MARACLLLHALVVALNVLLHGQALLAFSIVLLLGQLQLGLLGCSNVGRLLCLALQCAQPAQQIALLVPAACLNIQGVNSSHGQAFRLCVSDLQSTVFSDL